MYLPKYRGQFGYALSGCRQAKVWRRQLKHCERTASKMQPTKWHPFQLACIVMNLRRTIPLPADGSGTPSNAILVHRLDPGGFISRQSSARAACRIGPVSGPQELISP